MLKCALCDGLYSIFYSTNKNISLGRWWLLTSRFSSTLDISVNCLRYVFERSIALLYSHHLHSLTKFAAPKVIRALKMMNDIMTRPLIVPIHIGENCAYSCVSSGREYTWPSTHSVLASNLSMTCNYAPPANYDFRSILEIRQLFAKY